MCFAKRMFLLFFIFIVCVGCDQATKSVARSVVPESEAWSFFGDTLRLQRVYNNGGFLSLGASLGQPLREHVFTVGVGLFLLGLLAYLFIAVPRNGSEVFPIVLIFSGGVGNLIDRLTNHGEVLDFINLGIGPVRTGIFNVADVAITAGVLMLGAMVLRRRNLKQR